MSLVSLKKRRKKMLADQAGQSSDLQIRFQLDHGLGDQQGPLQQLKNQKKQLKFLEIMKNIQSMSLNLKKTKTFWPMSLLMLL